jgi:hypothetical protein
MKEWLKALRTVRGQFILFGATFLGAIVLAMLAFLLRQRVFEYYVREKYPELTEVNSKRIEELLALDVDPKRLNDVLGDVGQPDHWAQVYGAWIDQPDLDLEDRLAKCLASAFPDRLLGDLKRTLVAGDPAQRGRALAWLPFLPADKIETVRELVRFARLRALRRHEVELLGKADAVLEQLSPPGAAP